MNWIPTSKSDLSFAERLHHPLSYLIRDEDLFSQSRSNRHRNESRSRCLVSLRMGACARAHVICTFPEARLVGGDRGRGDDRGPDYVTSKMPSKPRRKENGFLLGSNGRWHPRC
ncbi:uncharacterized protein LOC143143499 [Ptiloglossa arizonensis]|uniref:uncharacterized protein LOC143143499 n=1 Tax=Ptiloglossa arizonensis TaxID=3350558 RepID=UPI003FA00C95